MHLIALFAFLLAADAVLAIPTKSHGLIESPKSSISSKRPPPTQLQVLQPSFGSKKRSNSQLNDIQTGLGSSWAHIGFGRDDGKTSGEYSPILYSTDVFSLVYSEIKWLSQTLDSGSFGWGAGSRRVVTIGVFEYKSKGKRFIHANTHLDNMSSQARSEGIKVVAARVMAVQGLYGPLGVTLTGDFNSAPDGDAYTTLQGTG